MWIFSSKFLSFRLLSKNFKVKIYKIMILPVLIYGCQIWSLTLLEECRLSVFEKKGPEADSWAQEEWECVPQWGTS